MTISDPLARPPEGDDILPRELEQAGRMVDQLVRHLVEKHIPPLAIASALLGGSMGVLSRELGATALLGVLEQACEAVRGGQFADLSGRRGTREA